MTCQRSLRDLNSPVVLNGVTVCYGSDLLGPLGGYQLRELDIRSKVLPSLDILRSATVSPARTIGLAESLEEIKAGFKADLLASAAVLWTISQSWNVSQSTSRLSSRM